MLAKHTAECTYNDNLTFDIRIPNDTYPDDILHISEYGIQYERNYSNGHKWTDAYSVFEFCPLCGTKYKE